MNAKEFKKLLSDRCVEVQKYGYKIASRDFGVEADLNNIYKSTSKCCCPIGAALLNSPAPSSHSGYIAAIATYCNISSDQAWSFIHGFDGEETTHIAGDSTFFKAGKEMRADFLRAGFIKE